MIALVIGPTLKVIGNPPQKDVNAVLMAPAALTCADMDMLLPLSLPLIAGLELTTLILYPLPVVVPAGNITGMLPAIPEVNVPITTGEVNDPAVSESCAVKTFPAFALLLIV